MTTLNTLLPVDGENEPTYAMTRLLGDDTVHLTVQAHVAHINYDADYEGREGPCEVVWDSIRVFVNAYGTGRMEITTRYLRDCREYSAAMGTPLMDDVTNTLQMMETDVLGQESKREAA